MKCSHSNDVAPLALGKSYTSIFHCLKTKEMRDLLVTEAFTEERCIMFLNFIGLCD